MNPWTIAAWGIGIAAGLYALHRLALWLEREGWVRYIRNPPSAGADRERRSASYSSSMNRKPNTFTR